MWQFRYGFKVNCFPCETSTVWLFVNKPPADHCYNNKKQYQCHKDQTQSLWTKQDKEQRRKNMNLTPEKQARPGVREGWVCVWSK